MLLKKLTVQSPYSSHFPYCLPFVLEKEIEFTQPVTFLVGDNGSGKTTLLEVLDSHLRLPRIGDAGMRKKEEKVDWHLASKVEYQLTKPRGFYLTAQDFSLYIYQQAKEKREAHEELVRTREQYKNRSAFAQTQASIPYLKTIYEIEHQYDQNLNISSHGESFLAVFKSRMRENQLYLLDEPETPLSFHNMLALLYMIAEAVKNGCQFIIATHSPILLAFPNAVILELSKQGVHKADYNNLEFVQLTKSFLNQPERFLNKLLE
ncbi:MAG: AAA family ATPase [Bacilli bacterium]|jgi:predicted ATPase|nr:AAA family ATPase [Bacilli bacterium]